MNVNIEIENLPIPTENDFFTCDECGFTASKSNLNPVECPLCDKEEEKPVAPPKRKHRARRKKATPATGLLEAIKFIKPCQKKTGTIAQRHCCIRGNWIVATNEILTIGTKIQEDLAACPQTIQLEEALKQVADDLSITQLSENSLSVLSGGLKAVVPCVGFDQITIPAPDENIAPIDDRIKTALSVLAPLVTEGAEKAELASAMLQSGTAVALNGHAVVEFWHGIDLPPNVLLPKAAIKAIVGTKKTLSGFGYSGHSATFWFEDDSFIKTQLYGEQYPNYKKFFEQGDLNPFEIPAEFFKAVKTIDKFTKSGIVHFEGGKVASNELENEASTYTIPGLPEGLKFHSKNLLAVQKAFEKVCFKVQENGLPHAYFFSQYARGLVLGIH